MAQWFHTEIKFIAEIPSAKELKKLNKILHSLDGDALSATELGIEGEWRYPILELQEILDIIHVYGYPCRGRWVSYYIDDDYELEDIKKLLAQEEFLESETDLSTIRGLDKKILKKASRRFGHFL